MASSPIYSVISIAIGSIYETLTGLTTLVLVNVHSWLETHVFEPLEFRETWQFRYQHRLQMAFAKIQFNIAMLTAYWLRQKHRRIKQRPGWFNIEQPIAI